MIKLIDLEVYKVALEIGEKVWSIVTRWDYFNRDTLGKQFINAADSIALNTAEGYGRFHFKENKNFNYYGRGSAFESTACLRKAYKRGLITEEENIELRHLFEKYLRLVNGYISSIGKSESTSIVKEDVEVYQTKQDTLNQLLSNEGFDHNDH